MTIVEIEALAKMMRREKVAELQVGDVRIVLHVFAYAPEVGPAVPGQPEEPPKVEGEKFDPLYHSSPLDPSLQEPKEQA